ncbi:MAG: glycosyltransferase family 61 protein, partial [Aridibacter famidurans]|nr:glycosyltransferase family 61 protein [Aridibacter famidurans]
PSCLFENLPPKFRFKMHLIGAGSVIKNKLRCLPKRLDYYFLMNVWSLGYHHWLAEAAPKFILFEDLLRKGRILMPKHRPGFIREFLDIFGFDNIEETEENVFARSLNVISNPNSGHFDAGHLAQFRQASFERLGLVGKSRGRKVYVTRMNAKVRKVVNDDELIGLLEGKGYEIFDLDNTPFIDQLKLFSETRIFVSLHGSALTNMIFMPPGGAILEFYPKVNDEEKELNACFYRMARVLGHEHRFIFSQREDEQKHVEFRKDNVIIDLAGIERELEEFEAAVQ